MALVFGTLTSDRVDLGSPAQHDNLNVATICGWIYYTAATSKFLYAKGTGAANNRLRVQVGATTQVIRDRATTDLNATATSTNFAAWATNKWVFVAAVCNTGGANADQKLFIGDLTTLAAEPSVYTTQLVGGGAVGDNAAVNAFLGNDSGFATALEGRIASVHIYNVALTPAQIQAVQFATVREAILASSIGAYELWAGLATDLSGLAINGTITGATGGDHVPRVWRGRSEGWRGASKVGGDTTLAAAVTVSVSAAGALTTDIRMAAASTIAVTTAGALTTEIRLAGAAAITATTAAALTTDIRMAGAVSVVFAMVGDLAGGALLAAAANLTLSAAGALTTSIQMAGNAALTLSAAGALTTDIRLAATPGLTIATVGLLTTDIRLAGAVSVVFQASGTLALGAALGRFRLTEATVPSYQLTNATVSRFRLTAATVSSYALRRA